MDYNELALKMHEENRGKVAVRSKVTVETREDLSTAYTPEWQNRAERSGTAKRMCTATLQKEIW